MGMGILVLVLIIVFGLPLLGGILTAIFGVNDDGESSPVPPEVWRIYHNKNMELEDAIAEINKISPDTCRATHSPNHSPGEGWKLCGITGSGMSYNRNGGIIFSPAIWTKER